MPVYIRSGELEIPAPSISSVGSDDEADTYIIDPDQVFDELPQPYRMVDRFLNQLLDNVWDLIVAAEFRKEEEAKRVLPPVYKESAIIPEFENCSCMCHSDDDRYVFVSFTSGELAAFDSSTHVRLVDWNNEEFNACFEKMTCAVIGTDVHIIATIDDMGFARLFVFANEGFQLIQLLNEQPEGSPKSNATKFNLSKNGDYCGIALECEDSQWLDVYKLPRDAWLREIEAAQREALKRAQTSSESIPASDSVTAEIAVVTSDMLEYKFSTMTLVLKVKCPPTLTGNNSQTQQDNVEKVGLPNTVGNCTTHLFSQHHLDVRRAMVKNIYEDLLQGHELDEPEPTVPTWHFLNPSRMQPETMGNVENIPVSVCVWWKNSHMAQIYPISLQGKAVKDVEIKPDLVWPMCGIITSSSVSDCTNMIAFGFENGFVSITDRHWCIPRAMVHIGYTAPVTSICILDGSVTASPSVQFGPTPMYCLIALSNGAVVFLDCTSNTCKTVVPPASTIKRNIYVKPLAGATQVFLSSTENGGARLYETLTGKVICELDVAESLEEPQLRFNFSIDDGIVYVRNEDGTVNSFCLRSYPSLDVYRRGILTEQQPLIVKETIEARCQRLLTERTSRQSQRTSEFATRWRSMNKELSVLLNLKSSDREISPATKSPSAASRWSESMGKITSRIR